MNQQLLISARQSQNYRSIHPLSSIQEDDNAHVEQKNWRHVSKLLGWDCYDSLEASKSSTGSRKSFGSFRIYSTPSMTLRSRRAKARALCATQRFNILPVRSAWSSDGLYSSPIQRSPAVVRTRPSISSPLISKQLLLRRCTKDYEPRCIFGVESKRKGTGSYYYKMRLHRRRSAVGMVTKLHSNNK